MEISEPLSDQLSDLQQSVLQLLQSRPRGWKEYDLLQALQEKDSMPPADEAWSANLALYHRHFVLFHALYKLRDVLLKQQVGDVAISVLEIRLLPYVPGGQMLGMRDELREYYLDLDNLTNSTDASVTELLNGFWESFFMNEHRSKALAVLGLQDPVDKKEIVRTYRRLAMRHHPDRGGDKDLLQKINQAYSELLG